MRWLVVVFWSGLAAALVLLTRFTPSEAPTIEQLLSANEVAEMDRVRGLFGEEPDSLLVIAPHRDVSAPNIAAALRPLDDVRSVTPLSEHTVVVGLAPGTLQLSRARELVTRVDRALATLPGETAVIGAPRMRVASWEVARTDLRTMWILLAIAAIGIPTLCFGSIGAALFPLALALLTTGATLLAYRWFTGPLNALSMLLVPLVWSVATLDAVHLYYATRRFGPDAQQRLWAPCLATTVTTAAGFGALALQGESQLIRSFGVWAAFGTCAAYVLTFTLGRSILAISSTGRPLARWPRRLTTGVVRASERNPKRVIVAWTVLAIVAGVFATRVYVDIRFPRVFVAEHPVTRDLDRVEAALGTDLCPLEIYVEASDERGHDPLQLIEAVALLGHYAATLDESRAVLPIDLAATAAAGASPTIEEWTRDPRLTPWIRFEEGAARLQLHFGRLSLDRRREIQDWLQRFDRNMLDHHRISFGGPGFYYPLAEAHGFAGAVKGGALALLVIAVVLALALGGGPAWLAAMVGNLLPLLLVFGLMGALAIPWSLALVPLPAVLLGLAVDDTVHLLWRRGSVRAGALRAGAPLLATTLLLAACVGTLLLSGLALNRELGLLLASAIVMALACDLSLIPALLRQTASRR